MKQYFQEFINEKYYAAQFLRPFHIYIKNYIKKESWQNFCLHVHKYSVLLKT